MYFWERENILSSQYIFLLFIRVTSIVDTIYRKFIHLPGTRGSVASIWNVHTPVGKSIIVVSETSDVPNDSHNMENIYSEFRNINDY